MVSFLSWRSLGDSREPTRRSGTVKICRGDFAITEQQVAFWKTPCDVATPLFGIQAQRREEVAAGRKVKMDRASV
jgi:hypothetical protein